MPSRRTTAAGSTTGRRSCGSGRTVSKVTSTGRTRCPKLGRPRPDRADAPPGPPRSRPERDGMTDTTTVDPQALLAEILLTPEGKADPYSRYTAIRESTPAFSTDLGFTV